ncbi:hypothetical protein BDW62DRAFT_198488 [Aspergillus aurantiobrunneus]
MARKCRRRDQDACVITKTLDCTEVAHIYSFTLGANISSDEHRFFWNNLSMYWSAE